MKELLIKLLEADGNVITVNGQRGFYEKSSCTIHPRDDDLLFRLHSDVDNVYLDDFDEDQITIDAESNSFILRQRCARYTLGEPITHHYEVCIRIVVYTPTTTTNP